MDLKTKGKGDQLVSIEMGLLGHADTSCLGCQNIEICFYSDQLIQSMTTATSFQDHSTNQCLTKDSSGSIVTCLLTNYTVQ